MKNKVVLVIILLALISLGFSANHSFCQSVQWAKAIGGTLDDNGFSITTDVSGNVYTTGTFEGTVDFDPGSGIYNLTTSGIRVFISKLDADGNFLWAKVLDGSSTTESYSLCIDASGSVYTIGYFGGITDFDPDSATYNLTTSGFKDIFISKLSADGNFLWARNFGGTSDDFGYSITTDDSGNVYTTGTFKGTADFDPGTGTYNLTSAGDFDIFISKLDANGNFLWAKTIGGTSIDQGYSVDTDASGNVYTTGYFYGTADFDPGTGTYNLTSAGKEDIFISKLSAEGNFLWAVFIGTTSTDIGYSITIDASGNVYSTGSFKNTVDFDPGTGTYNLVSNGGSDVFVSKLDDSGNFLWAAAMGGQSGDVGNSITADKSGNVYTTGYFSGSGDFDPGVETYNLSSTSSFQQSFVSILNTSGNFQWAGAMNGTKSIISKSIAVDSLGNVFTTGSFIDSADVDPGVGTYYLTSGESDENIFISKLSKITTGLMESVFENNFVIYPNISAGKFRIRVQNSASVKFLSLDIYNILGEKIYSIENINKTNIEINLSYYSKGIYFVKINDGMKNYHQKIIVQ